jgi:hypothetical protein
MSGENRLYQLKGGVFGNLQRLWFLPTFVEMVSEVCRHIRFAAQVHVCVGMVVAAGFGQEEPAELATVKRAFAADRARVLAPQLDRYARRLAELEKQGAEIRDYALTGEIEAAYSTGVKEWYKLTGIEQGSYQFLARDASLAGGVALSGEGAITGWGKSGTRAQWTVPPGVEAGAYEVSVDYVSGEGAVGIRFIGGRYQLHRGLQATAGERKNQTFTALVLDADPAGFSIAVDGGKGVDDLAIRAVEVKKIKGPQGEKQTDAKAAIQATRQFEPKAMDADKRESARRLYLGLSTLERYFAGQRQYRSAAAVQKEMAALTKVHGPLEAEVADKQHLSLVLQSAEAKTTGAIRYDRTDNALVGWKNEGNEASWELPSIDPGQYEIFATYGVTDSQTDPGNGKRRRAGGSFTVRQATGLVGEGTETITHRVTSTGDWDKFTVVKCGQMHFPRRSATVAVICGDAEELGVMHLRSLELRKIAGVKANDGRSISDQFQNLTGAHAREVETLLSPIEKTYLAALQKLTDAPSVKKEIDRQQQEMEERRKALAKTTVPERPAADGGVHVLSATVTDGDAMFLFGQAAVHSSGEFVTGLRPPDSYVQWNLNQLQVAPGDYEVIVDCRVNENMGGEFRIQCGSESVNGRVHRSPFGEINGDFRSLRFGILRITAAARGLRFEPLELDNRDGMLCDLRKITLEPFNGNGNGNGNGIQHVHPDGYTEWNRVTYVKGGSNSGDQFTVRHDGGNHQLRLYAVTCPPGSTSETRSEDLKNVRDHFGVSPNDLARGGRLAAQATEDALGRGPFSIFTKGKKAKDGAIFAWVVIENDTLLSGILVGRGLASIGGEEASVPEAIGRGIDVAKYRAWLEARGKEAKAAKEGIWRYHRD